jgi:hypothetical protein
MSDSKVIHTRAIRKTRSGDIVLTIESPKIGRWLRKFFFKGLLLPLYHLWSFIILSLEKTTGKRAYLLLATGLGLGIGLGVAVFSFPQYVNAVPTMAVMAPITIEIDRIKSVGLGLDVEVTRGAVELLPLVQLEAPAVPAQTSASIGQGQAIIIQGVRADYSFLNLDKAQLGQEILVVGSNGGWYRYRIVETKEVDYDKLSTAFTQSRETLILFTTNSIKQTATVIVARPLQ